MTAQAGGGLVAAVPSAQVEARVGPVLLAACAACVGLVVVRVGLWGPDWLTQLACELRVQWPTYLYLAAALCLGGFGLGALGARQAQRLARLASTDALTHLANRRYFEARLHHELRRAARYNDPLSLMVVDLDGLKRINDKAGHAEGDRAIVRVADVLQRCCRDTDLAARIGGDEFVILAPCTKAVWGRELALRIIADLAQGSHQAPTVSIGVADLTHIAEPKAAHLLAAADRAMYAAKNQGRNQVSLAPKLAGAAQAMACAS